MLLRLHPQTASPRLSAIEARVKPSNKYIGTSISIQTEQLYDYGHLNTFSRGIQVTSWTSSIVIREESLKQCTLFSLKTHPQLGRRRLQRALLAVTRTSFLFAAIYRRHGWRVST